MKIVHVKDDNSKYSYCDYTILQKDNLKAHNISVHKNVKFLKSNKCNYNSLFKNNLKAHNVTVHKNIIFPK